MNHKIAPYQLFFPLGLFNAFLAIGVWFVQDLHWFTSPTIFIHSKLIVGGFLWSFIVGFLMTAVPRMTGTSSANKFEYITAALLILSLMFVSFDISPKPFYALHSCLVLFLIFFAGRRILKSQKDIPVFFSHVGLAMALTLLGAGYYYQSYAFMGFHLYYIGPILLLILGIGTRFFSFLSGLPSAFENEASPAKRFLFHTCGVLVAILLYFAGRGFYGAYLFLGFLTLFYLFGIWKIQRFAERPSPLKWGIRFVAATIPLSFFLSWYQPSLFLTWFHLLFIGGFGLICFLVASRVILAHGAYPLELEIHTKSFWFVISFLILGIISRFCYGFSYDLMWRKSFLHTAATFWTLAIIIWGMTYLVKVFKPGPQSKPSC